MNGLTAWLLMLPLHAGVLLLAAWAIDAGIPSLRGVSRELLWRTALFGCLLTATVQAFAPPAVIGRWHWTWTASTLSVAPDTGPGGPLARTTPVPVLPLTSARVPPGRTVIQTAVARDSQNPDLAASRPAVGWTGLLGSLWLLGALITLARSGGSLLRLEEVLDVGKRWPAVIFGTSIQYGSMGRRRSIHSIAWPTSQRWFASTASIASGPIRSRMIRPRRRSSSTSAPTFILNRVQPSAIPS